MGLSPRTRKKCQSLFPRIAVTVFIIGLEQTHLTRLTHRSLPVATIRAAIAASPSFQAPRAPRPPAAARTCTTDAWMRGLGHDRRNAAIDVSLEWSSICIVDPSGRIVREAKVRSEREPSARAPPSNRSPVPPPTVGNRQIPIDPNAVARPPRVPCMGPWLSSTYFTAGPTSFRVSWFDLEARFFVPTHISNGGARRGRQDRPSLKPFPKLRRGQAASLRPRARWHAGWWSR